MRKYYTIFFTIKYDDSYRALIKLFLFLNDNMW